MHAILLCQSIDRGVLSLKASSYIVRGGYAHTRLLASVLAHPSMSCSNWLNSEVESGSNNALIVSGCYVTRHSITNAVYSVNN